jgi:hypothetical protein
MLFGLSQGRLHDAVGKVGFHGYGRQGRHVAAQRFQLGQELPIRLTGGQVLFDLGALGGRKLIVKKCAEQFVWEFACHNNQPCRYIK